MSDPTPIERIQAEQIEQLQMELLQMKARLDSYEQSDTIPPSSKQDAPTGDMTLAGEIANLLKRADVQDERESARAHALQEMCISLELLNDDMQQVKATMFGLKGIVEKYPTIDAEEFREMLEILRALPCRKGCDTDPDARSTLHSIRCAGE
jgi:hypothetical protein